MAYNFPNNPGTGQEEIDAKNQTWVYNGAAWVRKDGEPGIPDAPIDGVQYAREDGAWAKLAPDMMFLGRYPLPPATDNYGEPLQEGHIYYSTTDDKQKTWTGTEWLAFGPTITINSAKNYVWRLGAGESIPVNGVLSGPDSYGNAPSGWIADLHVVAVYKNGERLIEQLDAAVLLADYTINYNTSEITAKNQPFLDGDEITINVIEIIPNDGGVHPWVDYIEPGYILTPDEIEIITIHGGNFDQTTRIVDDDDEINIVSTNAVSDNILEVGIHGFAAPGNHPITVYNSERIQFGNKLTLVTSGQAFTTTWETLYANVWIRLPIWIDANDRQEGVAIQINWGDGNITEWDYREFQDNPPSTNPLSKTLAQARQHTYVVPGIYEVKVYGVLPRLTRVTQLSGTTKWLSVENLGDMEYTEFYDTLQESNINKFIAGGGTHSGVTSLNKLLKNANVKEISFNGTTFPNVTSITEIFANTSLLAKTDFINSNFSRATSCQSIFKYAGADLATPGILDITGLRLEAGTHFNEMFYASNYKQIINNLDVTNAISFREMFAFTPLEICPSNNWVLPKLESAISMYAYCSKLDNIDMSQWQAPAIKTVRALFRQCTSLSTLNVANLVGPTTDNVAEMFYETSAVTPDISTWDTSNIGNYSLFLANAGDQTSFVLSDMNMTSAYSTFAVFSVSNDGSGNSSDNGSKLSEVEYDLALTAWAAQSVQPNVEIYIPATYTNKTAHDILTSAPNNWNLTDDGFRDVASLVFTMELGTNESVVSLGLVTGFNYNFEVDWGDGTTDKITTWNQTESSHSYPINSTNEIRITGLCEKISFNTNSQIRTVRMGDVGLVSVDEMFTFSRLIDIEIYAEAFSAGMISLNNFLNNAIYLQRLHTIGNCFSQIKYFNYSFYKAGGKFAVKPTVYTGDAWDIASAVLCNHMFNEGPIDNIIPGSADWAPQNIENASYMLGSNLKIETALALNLQNWGMSNCTNLAYFFENCTTEHDVSNWDVSNVTNMRNMFYNYGASKFYIATWDTSSVTDMSYMFKLAKASNIQEVINQFDTAAVTTMTRMFSECTGGAGEDITFATFSMASTQYVSNIFTQTLFKSVDLTGVTAPLCIEFKNMFDGSKVETVLMPDIQALSGLTLKDMFKETDFLTYIDMRNFVTSNVTNISTMLRAATAVVTVNTANWDTSGLQNAIAFAADCFNLKNAGIAAWDITALTDANQILLNSFAWEEYDVLLTTWAAQTVQPNVTFSCSVTYNASRQADRDILTAAPNNWFINDKGAA